MGIKEKRHPDKMIDMTIVPFSMVIEGKMLDDINKRILKEEGSEMLLSPKHHILLIDLGEKTDD